MAVPIGEKGLIRTDSRITSDSTKTREYHLKDFYDAMNRMMSQSFGIEIETIQFEIKATNKKGEKLAGARITIKIPEKSDTIFYTDSKGKVSFNYNKSILMLDPVCIMEGGWDYKINTGVQAAGCDSMDGTVLQAKEVFLEDKKIISEDSLTIYYPEGSTDTASILLKYLKIQRALISQRLGLKPLVPWGIVLDKQEPPFYCTQENVWPHSLNERLNDEICPSIIHEWTEQSLVSSIPALQKERELRWVADGLAQIATYWWAKEHFSNEEWNNYKNRGITFMKLQLAKGIKKYDLKKWTFRYVKTEKELSKQKLVTPEEGLGYAIAPYFWLQVIEKSGEEVIPKFLNAAQKTENAKSEDFIKLLSQIIGLDIKKRLKVDVAEAINYFEGLQQ
ncbi:MAG: hypothetical protein AB1349_13010 [Elusimicrobiota bacterium]